MKLLIDKKIGRNGRSLTLTIHPMQAKELGIDYGDEVKTYIKGKKLCVEKKEN